MCDVCVCVRACVRGCARECVARVCVLTCDMTRLKWGNSGYNFSVAVMTLHFVKTTMLA